MKDTPGVLLEAKRLTMKFGGIVAVNDFKMKLSAGKIAGIIGPNGAGKTTIFNMITGVCKPTEGEILFAKQNITGRSPFEITRLGIARTFQNIRLFKGMDVLANVKVAAGYRTKYGWINGLLGLPNVWKTEKEINAEAEYYLEVVGLINQKELRPENLPYGLQRKLEIARALATKPKLLLLDEPAAGLNPNEVKELMVLIQKIHQELGISILLIEHHMEMVMGICEELWVLNFGKLIANGIPEQIQNNPKVLRAYLGD